MCVWGGGGGGGGGGTGLQTLSSISNASCQKTALKTCVFPKLKFHELFYNL